MVLISSKKYACETCIKGHRSSNCKHTDRPLFEIKKKGRPVTQCEHCRELRKTKQVHVKCICEGREHRDESKKGVLEPAAFPKGLTPEALQAAGLLSEHSSSDSDHPVDKPDCSCNCQFGQPCHCATQRKLSAKARRKRSSANVEQQELESSKTNAHILARIAELRPVLPKPPPSTIDGHVHSLSGTHIARHHHESNFYSPYGRAYDYTHSPDVASSSLSRSHTSYLQPDAFPPEGEPSIPMSISCQCGEACRCIGCADHSNSTFGSVHPPTCLHPTACGACFNRYVSSLRPPSQPTAILPLSDSSQVPSFDEWFRQFAYTPDSLPPQSQSSIPTISEPVATSDSFHSREALDGFYARDDAYYVSPNAGGSGLLNVPELYHSRSSSTSSLSSGYSSGHDSFSPTGPVQPLNRSVNVERSKDHYFQFDAFTDNVGSMPSY